MTRSRSATALVFAALGLGCSFSSSSADGPADLATSSSGNAAADSSDESTSGPDGTSSSSSGDQESAEGGGAEATDGPAEASSSGEAPPMVDPRADLVFVQPSPIDLGTHGLDGGDVIVLELENQGTAAASVDDAEPPPSPLIWAGGTFPGPQGTCEGLIPPGATCTVGLAVSGGFPGLATGSLEVHFHDDLGSDVANAGIRLIATGASPNLVVNPDAEADGGGPIMTGWNVGSSTFHHRSDHNHGVGQWSFFAGSSGNPTLTQEIELADFAASIDSLPMVFEFSGWSRARSGVLNDDPHSIGLRLETSNGDVLESRLHDDMTQGSWSETRFDVSIPAGTRRAWIELECDRSLGSNCSAWFDDFVGRIVLLPE